MTDDKWTEILDKIEKSFQVEERDQYDLDQSQGGGKAEHIIFTGPRGRVKLIREQKPKMVGRRVISSHRIGGASYEEFEYSDSELIDKISAWRWDEQQQDWQSIAADVVNF